MRRLFFALALIVAPTTYAAQIAFEFTSHVAGQDIPSEGRQAGSELRFRSRLLENDRVLIWRAEG